MYPMYDDLFNVRYFNLQVASATDIRKASIENVRTPVFFTSLHCAKCPHKIVGCPLPTGIWSLLSALGGCHASISLAL